MFSMILALTLIGPVSLTAAQTAEIQKVEKRLLAPCCYTQSIAEHGSAIAAQMRSEVEEMVAEGKSETVIVDHYRGIYGDRILIVPDGRTGRVLFALPVAIAALAGTVLFVYFRKMLRSEKHGGGSPVRESPLVLSAARKEQIEREVGDSM